MKIFQKNLKRLCFFALLFCCFFVMTGGTFLDDAKDTMSKDFKTSLGASDQPLTTSIGGIINVILSLLGVVLLGTIIYAGFLWMTAGGNDDQVKKAKAWIINSVIGLVLVLLAYAISSFVVDELWKTLN